MPRKWLESYLDTHILPALTELSDTPDGHAAAAQLLTELRQRCEKQGLKTLFQQQGPMDESRRFLKDHLGEDHFSLRIIAFTAEEYTQINNRKQGAVAERNEQTQFLDNPDAIVAQAVRLLESPEWAEIAAGLAVLTGRRSAELLSTATFTPKMQWSVTFTGALKRGGESVQLSFEIPTLTTAKKVCNALERLRTALPVEGLNPNEINKKYESAVARACDRHFAELVPARPGRDNLYTHLFRAVYATIATFWYCPPIVEETEFRAAVQGHFAVLDEQNPTLRRSLTASRHYADYTIADAVIASYGGKRKGIKLGHGGIEPIAMFAHTVAPVTASPRHKTASLRIWQDDRPTLDTAFELLGLNGDTNQQERMHHLIHWAHAQLTASPAEPVIPSPLQEPTREILAAVAPVSLPPVVVPVPTPPSPLESQLGELVTVMREFIAMQTERTQTSPVSAPAAPPRVGKPRTASVESAVPSLTVENTPQRKRRGTEEAIELAERAIAAIMAHNDAPGRLYDDKWAISVNTLKTLGSSQVTALRTLKEQAEVITKHHEQHQIDAEKHNLRHRRKQLITDVIKV